MLGHRNHDARRAVPISPPRDPETSGDPSEQASGNGSIMRLAPVPTRFASLFPDDVHELARLAAESSRTTHASPQRPSACRYLAVVPAGLINGVDRQVVLAPDRPPRRELDRTFPFHPTVRDVADGSFRDRRPPEIVGSGLGIRGSQP